MAHVWWARDDDGGPLKPLVRRPHSAVALLRPARLHEELWGAWSSPRRLVFVKNEDVFVFGSMTVLCVCRFALVGFDSELPCMVSTVNNTY